MSFDGPWGVRFPEATDVSFMTLSRTRIYALYVFFDLAIVAGVVWCVFTRWPVRQYLIPAAVLFVVNGIWLVVMTIRHTPPRNGANGN